MRRDSMAKSLNKISGVLASKIPETLTGSDSEMSRKLKSAFGDKDYSAEIKAEKQKNGHYWMIALMFILCLTAAIIHENLRGEDLIEVISRPPFAEQAENITAKVKAQYGSDATVKEVQLLVRPEGLTDQQKEENIKQTANNLPDMILGENESLDCIVTDLYLPERDPDTMVNITWFSDRPEVIDEKGVLNPVTVEVGDEVTLEARLVLNELMEAITLNLTLGEPVMGKKVEYGLEKILSGAIQRINESRENNEVILPVNDAYGVTYLWQTSRENYYPLMLIAIILFGIFLYKNKYRGVNIRIKRAREQLIRDFPEFINKLLILLNAGLVVQSAVFRIVEDYTDNAGDKSELYEELVLIKRKVESTNASFSASLNTFAVRSTVREIMRFAAILSDNIHKGASLADKLKNEGDLVWSARKKKAEETGRIAETKMIMPMSLILIVLIIISVAPAVLTM